MSTNRPNLLRAWWPATIWLGIITFESTDYMSGEHTSNMLYTLLTRLFGEINLYDFLEWHHYLRKAGHVVGYGILCLLMLRGLRMTFGVVKSWVPRLALFAWLGTAFVASLDEWHQSFIPSRTGRFQDVVLDSTAGLIALLVAYLWLRRSGPAGPERVNQASADAGA